MRAAGRFEEIVRPRAGLIGTAAEKAAALALIDELKASIDAPDAGRRRD